MVRRQVRSIGADRCRCIVGAGSLETAMDIGIVVDSVASGAAIAATCVSAVS